MEIRNLKTFLQIVESGSFTKAAEMLGYTQSTISSQVKQLETELDCHLFDRINRTVKLTDKGELLLRHALQIGHDLDKMEEDFNAVEGVSGQVRIVSPDSICEKMMTAHYAEFYRLYPHVSLFFSTANTETMLSILERNEADVIFTLDNHVYREKFITAKEAPVPLHFVTRADSPLANAENLGIRDILDKPFLLTEHGMSYRKVLDDKLAEESLQIRPVLETGRTDLIIACLESGDGISFLPEFVTKEAIEEGRLVYLDIAGYNLTIWKQLLYHRDKWLSKALLSFIEFVMEYEFRW